MSKKWTWIVIAVVVVVVAGIAWAGSDVLWHWLLAMHGKH
jgi:hypothetical protein